MNWLPITARRRNARVLVRTFVAALIVSLATAVLRGDTDTTSRSALRKRDIVWRDASHGGINCLLLLSYVHGHDIDYDTALDSIGKRPLPNSGAEILQCAKEIGFPLEARSISPEQLDDIPLPVIVHMDGDDPSEGLFCVLVGTARSRVAFMEGPGAVILSMDKELFLRRWTGVVMYRERNVFLGIPTFIGFTSALIFVLLIRLRDASSRVQPRS